MTLIIKAEASLSSTVELTANEMVALAKRLGTMVEVQFNDVTLLADENTDPNVLTTSYYRVVKTDYRHKVAAG